MLEISDLPRDDDFYLEAIMSALLFCGDCSLDTAKGLEDLMHLFESRLGYHNDKQ